MAYVGMDAGVVGVSSVTGLPWWGGDKVYFVSPGTAAGGGAGLRQFNIDPDGSETLQRTAGAIGVFEINTASGGAICLSADGTTIYLISHFGNSCQLGKVRASDLTLLGTFGSYSSSVISSSSNIIAMDKMISSPNNSQLVCGTEFNTQEIDEVAAAFGPTSNFVCGTLDTAPASFGVLLGPGGSVGEAYLLGIPFQNGTGTSTSPCSLYKLVGGGLTKLGSVTPANVDGTWTHFSYLAGIGLDVSDGNLLIGAQTTDAVTNKQYIVKLNSANGAVLWTRAVNHLTLYPWSLAFSRINGHYHYLDNAALVRHIKTSDGSQTTETFTGVDWTGPQFSDDTTNSIIQFGQFTAGGSPPQYVGSYMGTGGHHNLSANWMRFWFATAGPPPPAGSGRRHIGELGPVYKVM
jgi:hypothetical protein